MMDNKLIFAGLAFCAVMAFLAVGFAFLFLPAINSSAKGIDPSNPQSFEAFLKEEGIAQPDSSVEIRNVEEVGPGITRFDSYETTSSGLEHYRFILVDKNTGAYFTISQYVTSANHTEEYGQITREQAAKDAAEHEEICASHPELC